MSQFVPRKTFKLDDGHINWILLRITVCHIFKFCTSVNSNQLNNYYASLTETTVNIIINTFDVDEDMFPDEFEKCSKRQQMDPRIL